jgi:hypothetical protein
MSVIKMKAGQACHRCGSSTDLPHRDHRECLDAIDREVRTLLERTYELTARRTQLVRQHSTQITHRLKGVQVKLAAVRKKAKRERSA